MRILAVMALCVAVCAATAGERPRTAVELRPAAEVVRTQVLLSDIATVRGADAERLASLPVGEVSVSGASTLVERHALARWVQARLGAMHQEISWSGAERCRVQLAAGPAVVQPVQPAAREPEPARPAPASLLVAKGSQATLESSTGAIHLESRVDVLQDGARGQGVRVRLPNATEAFRARVVGQGRVEVIE